MTHLDQLNDPGPRRHSVVTVGLWVFLAALAMLFGASMLGYVWIRLADAAPPFDPSAHRVVPDLTVPIGLRPVGGLGVHLALSAVDAFEYAYAEGENRSTVLVRRCPGRSADDERRLS